MRIIYLGFILFFCFPLGAQSRVQQAQDIGSLEAGEDLLQQWQGDLYQSPLALGILYHQLSFWDAALYGPLGLELLEGLDEPQALAYRGSLVTLLASLEENRRPLKALAMLREGAELIDEALSRDEQDLSLRLLRLENGIEVSLSSPHKRYEVLAQDEAPILEWINQGGPDSPLEEGKYWYYLGELAMGLSQWEKALDYMYRVIERAPDSPWAEKAHEQLFLLEE